MATQFPPFSVFARFAWLAAFVALALLAMAVDCLVMRSGQARTCGLNDMIAGLCRERYCIYVCARSDANLVDRLVE